jgi:hypothetical protein
MKKNGSGIPPFTAWAFSCSGFWGGGQSGKPCVFKELAIPWEVVLASLTATRTVATVPKIVPGGRNAPRAITECIEKRAFMTPTRGPYERRRHQRLHMATGDCVATLIRGWGDKREREICTLVDVSYAGLRFRARRPLGLGEMVEFLIDLRSPVQRSGFVKARVRWMRPIGFQDWDTGVEFSEENKGVLLGPEEPPARNSSDSNR